MKKEDSINEFTDYASNLYGDVEEGEITSKLESRVNISDLLKGSIL